MRRTFVDRIVLIATISIFCAAIVVLFNQFRSVSPNAVLAFLATMPKRQICAAIGLTAASYLLLTGYDFLALRYVRIKLRFRDIVFASFTAFAFSNNFGFQLLSGGSMRYRIYSNLELSGGEIVRIVAFCTFTYALGVITVGGMVFVFEPAEVASLLDLPRQVISAAGLAQLAFIAAYLLVAAKCHGPIALRRFRVRPPTLILAIAQVALASIDAVLAGTVFMFCCRSILTSASSHILESI
jgi:phosphatidylglycerol lysyltransferase